MARNHDLRVRLSGGLGNQLFKVLAAIKIARAAGKSVLIDTSWYKTRQNLRSILDPRQVEISQFPEIASCTTFVEGDSRGITYRVLRNLPANLQAQIGFATDQNVFRYEDYSRLRIMDGNFMRVNLLPDDALLEKLLRFPKLNNDLSSSLQDYAENSFIAIHIRRGDYVRLQSIYGVLTPEYYETALSRLYEKIGKYRLVLFSDDPESSRSWLRGLVDFEKTFVSSHDSSSILPLMAMSMAKGIVTSNSTYSWWAAKIGELNGCTKFVVCPNFYQKSTSLEVTEGLRVNNWEYISTGVLEG